MRLVAAFLLCAGCSGEFTAREPYESAGSLERPSEPAEAGADSDLPDVQPEATQDEAMAIDVQSETSVDAASEAVLVEASAQNACIIDGIPVVCVTGAEYRVQSQDGGTILDLPCGESSPNCPSGDVCYRASVPPVLGVCP